MGGFAKKAGKHNREPSEEKIVLDVLRATHGRVKIRGNVNRWSVMESFRNGRCMRRAPYTHAPHELLLYTAMYRW